MKNFRRLAHENSLLFILVLIFTGITTAFLFCYSRVDGFLLLNHFHFPVADQFFFYYTSAGDGLFTFLVFIFLQFIKKNHTAWMVALAYAFSGIFSQLIKNLVHLPRPRTLLGHSSYPYFFDGITHVGFSSLPSGHTASAFAMACVLSFCLKAKWWAALFLPAAMLVGYSRIYLGQHFPVDVLAGALLGFLSSLLAYFAYGRFYSMLYKAASGPDLQMLP